MTVKENPPFSAETAIAAPPDDPLGVGLARKRGIELGPIATSVMLDNDYVRVWDGVIQPRETFPFHMHYHPHLLVAMTEDEAVAETIFGAKRFGSRTPGRVVLLGEPEPVHQLTNISEAINVTRLIEIKTLSWDDQGRKEWPELPSPARAPDDRGVSLARERGISLGSVGHSVLMDNDLVRVWEILLQPNETLPFHLHMHPYVVVTVEGSITAIETIFGETMTVRTETGGVVAIDRPESVHRLTNIGDRPYRSRLVEVKGVAFEVGASGPATA